MRGCSCIRAQTRDFCACDMRIRRVSDVKVFLHQTFALYGSYIRNCHGYCGESVPVHCECQSWLLPNSATFAIASLHKLIYII